MTSLLDLVGQEFCRLTVVERGPNSNGGRTRWWCVCECGSRSLARGESLRNGRILSCGCLRRESARTAHTVHGHNARGQRHPVYSVWAAMRQRCGNPKNPAYDRYGGRGITVCEEWADFATFFAYVTALPHYGEHGRTLDRIDNDRGYTPGNVRWATYVQQARNRRPRRKKASA